MIFLQEFLENLEEMFILYYTHINMHNKKNTFVEIIICTGVDFILINTKWSVCSQDPLILEASDQIWSHTYNSIICRVNIRLPLRLPLRLPKLDWFEKWSLKRDFQLKKMNEEVNNYNL